MRGEARNDPEYIARQEEEKAQMNAAAFPAFSPEHDPRWVQFGMSKREFFAGLALQGMLVNADLSEEGMIEDIATDAVRLADELTEALEL